MADSPDILIGNPDAHHVQIRPLSRSLSGLFGAREGSWIDCDVEIAAGAFHGHFRADFQSEELQTFLDGVQALQRTTIRSRALRRRRDSWCSHSQEPSVRSSV